MKNGNKSLTEAREDYLEAILILSSKASRVRPIDIARLKDVSKATVSVTLSTLVKMGYVQAENPHSVALTQKGLEVAQSVLRKHELLLGFLTEHLGVSAAVAREAACKMEHAIGAPIADKLANFISKLKGAELGDGTCARLCNLGGVRSNCSKRKKRKVFFAQ